MVFPMLILLAGEQNNLVAGFLWWCCVYAWRSVGVGRCGSKETQWLTCRVNSGRCNIQHDDDRQQQGIALAVCLWSEGKAEWSTDNRIQLEEVSPEWLLSCLWNMLPRLGSWIPFSLETEKKTTITRVRVAVGEGKFESFCFAFIFYCCLIEKQRETENFQWLVHSPDACNAWGGVNLKPEVGNFIQVFRVGRGSESLWDITCCIQGAN